MISFAGKCQSRCSCESTRMQQPRAGLCAISRVRVPSIFNIRGELWTITSVREPRMQDAN